MEDKIFETYPEIKKLIDMSGRDIDSATLKLVEELGEFTSANFGLKSYKKNTPEDLQEEVVDLLQCAMGLYSLVQEKYPFDGKGIMDKKLEKWESKYVKDDGSITLNGITISKEDKEYFFMDVDDAYESGDDDELRFIFSAEHLEDICTGDTGQDDDAYEPLIKKLKELYKLRTGVDIY